MKNNFLDSILPFQIDDKNLRGRFARIEKLASDTIRHHRLPDKVCKLLFEALLLTVLIGEMIKIRWRLSLQIRGNSSIKLLATDYYAPKQAGKPANIMDTNSLFAFSIGEPLDPGLVGNEKNM